MCMEFDFSNERTLLETEGDFIKQPRSRLTEEVLEPTKEHEITDRNTHPSSIENVHKLNALLQQYHLTGIDSMEILEQVMSALPAEAQEAVNSLWQELVNQGEERPLELLEVLHLILVPSFLRAQLLENATNKALWLDVYQTKRSFERHCAKDAKLVESHGDLINKLATTLELESFAEGIKKRFGAEGQQREGLQFYELLDKPHRTDRLKTFLAYHPDCFGKRGSQFEERMRALQEKIRPLSAQNRQREENRLTEALGEDVVKQEYKRVEESLFLSINVSFWTLPSILEAGCLKSCWETHSEPTEERRQKRYRVEKQLSIRDEADWQDTPVIYGGVGCAGQEHTGAASLYGKNCYLRLKKDRVKDRILFTRQDSYTVTEEQIPEEQFCIEDVALAKTSINLQPTDSPYVEFQLMGGLLSLDEIEAVCITEDCRSQAKELEMQYPHLTFEYV